MEWVLNTVTSLFSQSSTPLAPKGSLKRKRARQPNSPRNPIILDDGHDSEDEIVEDSEEERQEVARRAYGTGRSIRPRLDSAGGVTQNGRRQLKFGGSGRGPSTGRSTSTAEDEDELDTILPDQPSQARANSQAHSTWEAQRQQYEASVETLQRELQSKEDELRRLESELDLKRKQLSEGEERSQQLEFQLSELAQREQHARGESFGLARRCEDAESKLAKTKSLLKSRTEELGIAQAFMTTADQFSVADLVRIVEELNNDIYQASIILSEMVLEQKRPATEALGEVTEVDEARKAVAGRYGEELTDRLVSDLAQDDPDTVLFESLIQNVFTTRCAGLIQSICLGSTTIDKALRGVWEKLVVTRGIAIAKNWLAMTSSQLKTESIESTSTSDLLISLLTLGGYASPDDKLQRIAHAKLSQIQEKALKVREMATEGILSAELEAFRAPTKRAYNAAAMQDAYDSPQIPPEDVVVCQTALGLRYIKRVPTISNTSGPAQSETLRTAEIILKAKVLLSSTLAPQPPP